MAGPCPPIRLVACGCITPLGNASETCSGLIAGVSALRPVPLLGRLGGDLVPLALLNGRALDDTCPPAWLEPLKALGGEIPGEGWGTHRRPVFVTGSNFGVGGLYALRRFGEPSFAVWGAPPTCTEQLRLELGWGPDVSIVSHACVSAHLGLLQATRVVQAGLADRALVFSFDFLSPFVTGGFHALRILNGELPAPFRERPTGSIGLGDGAAFAVVAREGGDWSLEGQTLFNEMHHFTANRADGSGFQRCLEGVGAAANGARVWYKGHGTGTLEAGRMEVAAATRVFPDSPIVGWKGGLGHTLGSCGLVELAIVAESLRGGVSPGTPGGPSPLMADTVAQGCFSTAEFDGAICASNAFGGAHAAFLLRHA